MSVLFGNASFASVINTTSNTTIVGSAPEGIQAGEMMLAQLTSSDSNNPGTASAPAGWNVVASNYETNGNFTAHQLIAWKLYEGTEVEVDFTFGVGESITDDMLVIRRVYGTIDNSNPISIVSTFDGGTTASRSSPAVTTTAPNSAVIFFAAVKNGASVAADDTGEPTGTTILHNRRSRANSNGIRTAAAYEVVAGVGDTGEREWVDFTSTPYYGSTLTVVVNEKTDPAIDSTGTDTTLVNGSSQQVSFTGLAATPTSVSLAYGGNVFAQPNFSMGAVTEGVGTANFTATIGNLPYTSVTYPASEYSYIVTCEDDSELTLSGITIAPAADRSFVTGMNPANNTTSIISDWIEGVAVTGDQIDYPEQVENVTLTVNPDFTHTGVVPDGEEFPSSISFDINYWDSVSGERYPVTIELSFKENNSEILEFVPSSTDAISVEFFASSEGFINEQVPATTDSLGGIFNGLSNVIVNELVPSSTDIVVSTFEKINFSSIVEFIPSSTDSINVTFDQPVRVNEQVPAPTDSIIIFYGENLFTPSLSRTLYIKP